MRNAAKKRARNAARAFHEKRDGRRRRRRRKETDAIPGRRNLAMSGRVYLTPANTRLGETCCALSRAANTLLIGARGAVPPSSGEGAPGRTPRRPERDEAEAPSDDFLLFAAREKRANEKAEKAEERDETRRTHRRDRRRQRRGVRRAEPVRRRRRHLRGGGLDVVVRGGAQQAGGLALDARHQRSHLCVRRRRRRRRVRRVRGGEQLAQPRARAGQWRLGRTLRDGVQPRREKQRPRQAPGRRAFPE